MTESGEETVVGSSAPEETTKTTEEPTKTTITVTDTSSNTTTAANAAAAEGSAPVNTRPRDGSRGLADALKGRAEKGGVIVATWDLRCVGCKPDQKDWVGIFYHHRLHNRKYYTYAYTKCTTTGSVSFTGLKPGYYDLRLFLAGTYDAVARTRPILIGPSVSVDTQLSPDNSMVCVAIDTILKHPDPRTTCPSVSDADLAVNFKNNWFGLYNCNENGNYARQSVSWRYVSQVRSVQLPVDTPATVDEARKAVLAKPPPFVPSSMFKKPPKEEEKKEDKETREVLFWCFPIPPAGVYEVRFFYDMSSSVVSGNLFSGISRRLHIPQMNNDWMFARPLTSHRTPSGVPYGFEDKPTIPGAERYSKAKIPHEKRTNQDMKPEDLIPGTVSKSTLECGKYVVESKYSDVTHDKSEKPFDENELFDHFATLPGYVHFFLNQVRPHSLVFAVNAEDTPIIFAVEDVILSESPRRLVMWTPKSTKRFVTRGLNAFDAVRNILSSNPAFSSISIKWYVSTSNVGRGLLYKFDVMTTVSHEKFGIVYAAPGQSRESEMLHNPFSETSPAFKRFLELMGERVTLKDFNKFAGGLDVSGRNNTGETSVYTEYGKGPVPMEIMFHVAPLIPNSPNDPQSIDRKRHIGNDVCVLIFKDSKDGDDCVAIDSFLSHFNSIFIVVTPVRSSDETVRYRVTVACKKAVRPFPPFFPKSDDESGEFLFAESPYFREWLLQKLINGERVTMETDEFRKSHTNSRKQMLKEVITKCLEDSGK